MTTTEPLGARARSLLDAAQAVEPRLDDDAAARLRGRVLDAVVGGAALSAVAGAGTASSTGGVAGGITGKLIVIGALVVAGVGGGVVLGVGEREAKTETRGRAGTGTGTGTSGARGDTRGRQGVGPAVISVDSLPAATANTNANANVTANANANVTANANAAPPANANAAPPANANAAPATNSSDAFGRDLRSLDRARQALAAGDPRTTIAETNTPSETPAFTEERAALHAIALCAAGQQAQGQRELARFRSAYPRSLQLARADRACAVTDPSSDGHSPR